MAFESFIASLFSSPQAKAATVGYLLLLASVIASIVTANKAEKNGAAKLSEVEIAIMVLLIVIGYILSIFSINCMVVGNCDVWAWVNSIIVFVFAIASFFTIFLKGKF
jgi:hypothetical protein